MRDANFRFQYLLLLLGIAPPMKTTGRNGFHHQEACAAVPYGGDKSEWKYIAGCLCRMMGYGE